MNTIAVAFDEIILFFSRLDYDNRNKVFDPPFQKHNYLKISLKRYELLLFP